MRSAYLDAVGEHKLGWRAFRRELVYRLSGQERYRIDRLCDRCRRGLWLYFGVPQIGDALMDLAPRSLFADAGVEVDLATDPNLTDLFRADPWFAKVLPDPSAIGDATYDFVIVPSHKHRSLKMKQRHLPRQPWFSLHARFTGPEFHRGEFAARRIADFLASGADGASPGLARAPEIALPRRAGRRTAAARPRARRDCARARRRRRAAQLLTLARSRARAGAGGLQGPGVAGQRERNARRARNRAPRRPAPRGFTTSSARPASATASCCCRAARWRLPPTEG